MLRRSLTLVFVGLFTLPIARPQQLIENPAKPPAKNAGRVVSLERLFSIREGPPGEPLRGPYDIQVGDDGSIYFYDNFEFHKFSPNGKFVFKIVRSGQGPGEAQMRTVALAKGDEIVVLANSPRKIMWFDKTGKLLRELRTQDPRRYLYLFAAGGRMYGFREGDPPRGPDVVAGYVDVPTWLDEIEPDSGQPTARMSFPVQNYVVAGGGAWWQSLFLEFATSDGKTLFITHTPEYKVLKYDLVLNKVISAFGKRYARVALPSKKKTPSRPGQLCSTRP